MAFAGTSRSDTLAQRLVPQTGFLAHPIARDGLLVVLGSLFMVLCTQIRIELPFTPVPITGQTLGVYLIGALYGPRLAILTLLTYLAQGLIGLPVFAGGLNAWSPSRFPGLPVILGPTAGYLFAFPLAAGVVGYLAARGWDRRVYSAIPAMLLGELVILSLGFAWLAGATAIVTGTVDIALLFGAAVLPFLPGAAIKITLAALALPGGWALLRGRNRSQ
jgi:biotin transport system substrate-specific component